MYINNYSIFRKVEYTYHLIYLITFGSQKKLIVNCIEFQYLLF